MLWDPCTAEGVNFCLFNPVSVEVDSSGAENVKPFRAEATDKDDNDKGLTLSPYLLAASEQQQG